MLMELTALTTVSPVTPKRLASLKGGIRWKDGFLFYRRHSTCSLRDHYMRLFCYHQNPWVWESRYRFAVLFSKVTHNSLLTDGLLSVPKL